MDEDAVDAPSQNPREQIDSDPFARGCEFEEEPKDEEAEEQAEELAVRIRPADQMKQREDQERQAQEDRDNEQRSGYLTNDDL
jgi:hypothetical protein